MVMSTPPLLTDLGLSQVQPFEKLGGFSAAIVMSHRQENAFINGVQRNTCIAIAEPSMVTGWFQGVECGSLKPAPKSHRVNQRRWHGSVMGRPASVTELGSDFPWEWGACHMCRLLLFG